MNAAQIALLALFDLAAVEFDGEGERTLIVDVQLFVVLRNQGADDRIGPGQAKPTFTDPFSISNAAPLTAVTLDVLAITQGSLLWEPFR